MYPAKAEAIANAAFATWGKGNFDKVKKPLIAAIYRVSTDTSATARDIDVPKEYAHAEFIKLARALAENPLAA